MPNNKIPDYIIPGMAVVRLSDRPTRRDKRGCGGIYVISVHLHPELKAAICEALARAFVAEK